MRRTAYLCLCLLPLAACGPVFKLDDGAQTCSAPFLEWSGGLTRHVLQGNGNGEFDWNPPDPGLARVVGAYDLKTGGIDYVVEYDPSHARVSDTIVGWGTLWPDGDMDLGYEVVTRWADGTETSVALRDQRFGCDVSQRAETVDAVEFVFGTFDADGLSYSREYAVGAKVVATTGAQSPNWTYTESVNFVDAGYELSYDETSDVGGTIVRDVIEKYDGVSLRGQWTRQLSGETTYDYRVTDQLDRVEKWIYTVDLAGNGFGTLELDAATCDLAITAFSCEKVGCGKDFNGACTIPLIEPRR